jgi:luciferase family oxidoreductase group 1
MIASVAAEIERDTMRLGVLDQSTVVTGRAPAESIRETLELARLCDGLGYHRYWLAEHHNSDAVAGAAPEVLMAAIAATTRTIRVGSAGIMLPHYSSLKVAEQFRVLEAIAPGRIDMGLGRAPGSDGLTAHALNPNAASAAEQFPAQVRDLLAWVAGERLVERHPFRDVRAQPAGPTVPQAWMLGSSDYGAQVAAHFGLPYCFAQFITDGEGMAEAIALYRDAFRPSAALRQPYVSVCVWAVAADTAAAAERLYSSRALWRLSRDRGEFVPLPSPEEAEAHSWTTAELARAARNRSRAVVGDGAAVVAQLRALAQAVGADEVAVLSTVHDAAARRRSYALIAREAGLAPNRVALAAE